MIDTARHARQVDAVFDLCPVIPVLTIEHLDDAVPLAAALAGNGLPVLEVTLRTACALEAITLITREVPEACVGAGTVLNRKDLEAVMRAGALFAISPGATDALYRDAAACFEAGTTPLIPGIATASELMRGMEHGWQRFKFFPAESSGGINALRGFAGPFAHVRFCPTGGIDAAKASGYLAQPNVACVGGSWMVPADALKTRDWKRIGQLAREAAALR